MTAVLRFLAAAARVPRLAAFAIVLAATASLAPQAGAQAYRTYTVQEIVDAGHGFFGSTSGALAGVVERLFEKYGLPNGYILGEEAGGAFIGGLRYGEGTLFTKNAGDHKVYWQGPSIGWDYGIGGTRTMMLVYNLPTVDFVYNRFFGVSGSAFVVGGLSATALTWQGVNVVPISTGLGIRLGINVGYLKMSQYPKINPF
ncbi:MAG: hypothetical protein BroJett030_18920 [Alphaproteobacteria bacterium]|nr:MAG: hypothetical protein BroJett030_18920 [Alphaproteobacteria bacterium]